MKRKSLADAGVSDEACSATKSRWLRGDYLPRLAGPALRRNESRLLCLLRTRAHPGVLGFRRSSGRRLRDQFRFGRCKPLQQLYQHRRTVRRTYPERIVRGQPRSVLARNGKGSGVGLDRDVHGAGAEGADEEPGETAGAIDGQELEVIAGGNVQVERLPIPGIVDAEAMPARSDGNRDRVAVHEYISGTLAVELYYDLTKLDIVGRSAADGDLRLRSPRRNRRHGRNQPRSDLERGQERLRYLLLEEILKSLTRVVVARRRRRGSRSSLLRVGSRCGVFFDGRAKFVERAVVLRVLWGDAVRDGLRAFKLSAAVEEAALLATVELECALGILTVGVKTAGEHCATI